MSTDLPQPSRRALLLAAGGGLLTTLCHAQSTDAATSAGTPATISAANFGGPGAIVLDPIALAILHHARGDASWSSRQKIRNYLKAGGPTGLLGINPLASPTASQLSPDAQAIGKAWQNLLLAGNAFQRARDFQQLVSLVDGYAARVLSADRYFLPLNGQGFLSYEYLDGELLNDAGLVEPNYGHAALRFGTLDHGTSGAIQLLNLRVQQLSPGLKAPVELYRIPTPDTVLAERLLKDKAATSQLLEVQLRATGASTCFPRGVAMKGAPRPLAALAVEFIVIDSAGNKLHAKSFDPHLRQGKKGSCSVAG
ncbi:hypothetical protein [Roseateles violae]|uniref:Uncharacterized protein n=1 Tax=Roseateles violae TaxID=3058042 RepID=A0ABT8DKJ7_9BURK|nr:hypothetical protein [Pelomonas sp. PFR6]MDN3918939.1 hypothetical protein [Pelomonas sp. PFR6]